MGDVAHNVAGENQFNYNNDNPLNGNKVHLWGHKSPINVDHTTYNFEHDPDLTVEVDIPLNKYDKRKTSAGIRRITSASALSGSGTDRSIRSSSGLSPAKSRSRPMKPHEV